MGLASQPAQEIDLKVVDDVRNFLFGPPGAGGLDLAALNIQRGRDHGLPDYNTLRQAYGLSALTDFVQITSDVAVQSALEILYGQVDNIDAWVGGLAEDHLAGASVGELVNAALVDQFTRLRDGDRLFYLNDPDLAHPDIQAIIDLDQITLADIIMLNSGVTSMQADVFLLSEPSTIALASLGQTYRQDFDSLGGVNSMLPLGWNVVAGGAVLTTITETFPTAAAATGTYDAGAGGDRTLANGNTDRDAANAIRFWGSLNGDVDVGAVVLDARIEAWASHIFEADTPGEAAFLLSLEFDADGDGTYDTAHTFNDGSPVTIGLILSAGVGLFDGNGAAGTSFASGLVELDMPIPASSNIRLTFDAQGVGQTQGYIFGVDDIMFRIVAPGDMDGNGEVDSDDLFNILDAGKYNHPELGPAMWGEGDFTGDTLVNSDDLFAMLGAAKFNAGPYTTSTPPAALAAVPEPSSIVLAVFGFVGLLAFASWRRLTVTSESV